MTTQKGKDKLTEGHVQSHYFIFDVALQTPTMSTTTTTGFTSETALRNSE